MILASGGFNFAARCAEKVKAAYDSYAAAGAPKTTLDIGCAVGRYYNSCAIPHVGIIIVAPVATHA